jgi:DNA-binding winged helix-turn-helix (wHTH) protein/tetratricopeptide (TPR) repeat protein
MAHSRKITFDDFTLDTNNESLWKGAQIIHLRPKSFSLLRQLITHPGELITKDTLMKSIWPDCNIGEEALKHCVREIRKALGDTAEIPHFIETVHRRGYRFITVRAPKPRDNEGKRSSFKAAKQDPSGDSGPFVGRQTELVQLQQHLDKATEGSRQIVFLSGEQGIGKTRLVDAFLDIATSGKKACHHTGSSPNPWIARGQCIQSHGSAEAYMPFLEALTELCRMPERRRIVAALHRYAPMWVSQMPSLANSARMRDIQRNIQDANRERMLRELAEAFEELTADRLLILVLEDVHWSDHSSLDWISYWAQRRGPARLMLIATYRTAEAMTDDHLFKNIRQELNARQLCHEIPLPFLDEAAIGEYLLQRFPAHCFPAEMAPWIQQRTGGNPLFIANILTHITEQGLIVHRDSDWILDTSLEKIELTVPPTIRQIVDRQIEQCTPGEQQLLQAGSVNGMEFSVAGVASVLGKEEDEIELLCRGLAGRNQFLQPAPPPHAVSGRKHGACYRFIHVLYRNICYQLIPSEQRARFHRRAAAFIECEGDHQSEELNAQLAMHLELGREYLRAARYYLKAVDNANARYAGHEALELATRGIQLLEMIRGKTERTELEIHLQNALGTALISSEGPGTEKARQAFSRARSLFSRLGPTLRSIKKAALFNSLYGLWNYHWGHADYGPARRLAEQLVRLSKDSKDPLMRDRSHFPLGIILMDHGEYASALKHLEQSSGVKSRCCAEIARCHLGYVDSALDNIENILADVLETRNAEYCIFACLGTARLNMVRREFRKALDRSQSALDIALSQEIAEQWLTPMRVINGWAMAKLGKREKGQRLIHQALTIYKDIEASNLGPMLYAIYAEILLDGNQIEEGLVVIDGALEASHRTHMHHYDAELYRLKGELLRLRHKREESISTGANDYIRQAENCLKKAAETARRQQAKSHELRAVISLAQLWISQDRKTEAKKHLAKIYGWFTEGHNTADHQNARKLLEDLNE